MKFLYSFFIYVYLFAIRVAALFNPKAKLWVAGRKGQRSKLDSLRLEPSSTIWIHCASLGEFEQGRPLIEKIKSREPQTKIILTFFSPSGYEIRKNYSGADLIFYLPIDTFSNATNFIELIKPKAVFFIKYEFWFNYLNVLKIKKIPTYLISGVFRKEQHFFKSYGNWFRKQLNCFTHFYLQDETSSELLKSIGYANTTVTGDTRFDRVNEIAKNVKQINLVKQFAGDKEVVIAGSTWDEDEKIITNYFANNQQLTIHNKLIIAPHEIDEKHIESIVFQFSGFSVLKYSQATEQNIKEAQVLIIDNIGMLSSLYQYGSIAFIGGGFGKGIHNILEAATFGLPVIFGPNYQKFTEAKELIYLGGAFSITDLSEFKKTMQLLTDKLVLQTASHISKQYVQSRVGATDKIINSIQLN